MAAGTRDVGVTRFCPVVGCHRSGLAKLNGARGAARRGYAMNARHSRAETRERERERERQRQRELMRNARTHPTPPTGLLGVGCSGARSRCSSPSPPTLPRLRPRVMLLLHSQLRLNSRVRVAVRLESTPRFDDRSIRHSPNPAKGSSAALMLASLFFSNETATSRMAPNARGRRFDLYRDH